MSHTSQAYIVLALCCISLLIWLVLSFTQKRAKKCPSCCYGRPSVIPPINFLNPRHRLIYAVACAAQSSLWLQLLFESHQIHLGDVSKWISLILKAGFLVLGAGIVLLLTFPILACIEPTIPMVGYSLGLIYSIIYLGAKLYTTYYILSTSDLYDLPSSVKYLIIGRNTAVILPQTIWMIILIIWYIYQLCHYGVSKISPDYYMTYQQRGSKNHHNYVKQLLKRSHNKRAGLIFLYTKISLPLPLLIATTVSFTIVFQLLVFTISTFPYLTESLLLIIKSEQQQEESNPSYFIELVEKGIHSVTAILVIAPSLSAILIVLLLLHLLHVVKKETLLIRKGKSNLTSSIRKLKWPSLKLTGSVRYCGYQIASIITGWMFYSITFFICGFFFLGFYIAPEFFGYILYFLVVTALLVVGATVVEGLMCKFAFLSTESSSEGTIIITNRRVFNSFSYFILLYNVATGLYTSTIRLIMAFLTALLLKPRLDRIIFISPFQLLDTGHSMYKSFMITEALLHNPVVHVFIDLISKKPTDNGGFPTWRNKPSYRVSQRAKNRWLVAYTKLKNGRLLHIGSNENTSVRAQCTPSAVLLPDAESQDYVVKPGGMARWTVNCGTELKENLVNDYNEEEDNAAVNDDVKLLQY